MNFRRSGAWKKSLRAAYRFTCRRPRQVLVQRGLDDISHTIGYAGFQGLRNHVARISDRISGDTIECLSSFDISDQVLPSKPFMERILGRVKDDLRSEEHTSELQSRGLISYAV